MKSWFFSCRVQVLRIAVGLPQSLFYPLLVVALIWIVRLNLINHPIALFRAKFACILTIRNPVFRWESCKGSVWESVKNCSSVSKEAGTCGWISRVARGYKPPYWCTRAKHARSWNVVPAVHYKTKVPGWLGRLLTAWTCDSTQSWGQAARTLYLAKYDFSHSFSPYYIYTLISTI